MGNHSGVNGAKVYDFIQGIFFVIVAVIAAYGVFTGFKVSISLASERSNTVV
jgi:hypothetical protein